MGSDGRAVDISTETVAFLLEASKQTHPLCPIRRAPKGVALKKKFKQVASIARMTHFYSVTGGFIGGIPCGGLEQGCR